MPLFVTYGDLRRPGSPYISHYCGLPVLAQNESEARAKTLAALGDDGKVCGVREVKRMPIVGVFEDEGDYLANLAATLTGR